MKPRLVLLLAAALLAGLSACFEAEEEAPPAQPPQAQAAPPQVQEPQAAPPSKMTEQDITAPSPTPEASPGVAMATASGAASPGGAPSPAAPGMIAEATPAVSPTPAEIAPELDIT